MRFVQDFAAIDLSAAWLAPFLPMHLSFADTGKTPLATWLNDYFIKQKLGLYSTLGKSLSFTDQSDLPHGVAYECYIGETGKIPTRDNLHDWFGANIWVVFPKCKAMLNHHHLKHLDDGDTDNGRNRVRDAITVFDENGIIVAVSDEKVGQAIGAALGRFDWQNSLVAPRAFWHNPSELSDQTHAQAFIFGHALLEQLITPRKNLCAHALIVTVRAEFFEHSLSAQLAYLDELVADKLDIWLSHPATTPRDLQPLPVLGVPYFWQGQDDVFYQDKSVFREGRRR
ncbi:DUF3025 domain-containing protein [Moraxella sp. FZLJ2107]|uniref:DUF3025 domain-containing protein n=1 Tax=unclassified Moraxella TaxID=2685852 RepID=UPI0020C9171D|nr:MULTISPECIES: DUF3025 domain-containing protein [unclassified Moraxella]UTO04072.1 DUF3025 domain-containing protein [Moraxella sp. FZLJ2107]UTO22904.1 DUF3025 domain-containing protein [Moraxella sp. FZLJ2109]